MLYHSAMVALQSWMVRCLVIYISFHSVLYIELLVSGVIARQYPLIIFLIMFVPSEFHKSYAKLRQ